MKMIFKQYFQIVGHALIGIAFGFASFYLFLNMYHYRELRREVHIDFSKDMSILQLNETLDKISENIQAFQEINYQGRLNYVEADLWKTKLNACVQSFRNETFQNIMKKDVIQIQDVYDFRESFESDILNTCVVKQLYSLSEKDSVGSEYIIQNQKLLKSYMDDLLQDTVYLKKDLNVNSRYFFTTDIVSLSVKNDVEDGFYEVISSYNRVLKFLENISEWYKSEVGGIE